MNHYDGPAFFRKYRRPEKSNQKPERPQLRVPDVKKDHRSQQPAIVTKKARKQVTPEPVKTPVEPKKPIKENWRTAVPFRPSAVPKQLYYQPQSRERTDFSALIQKYFDKPDTDVLLFDQGNQTKMQTDRSQFTFESNAAAAAVEDTAVQAVDDDSDKAVTDPSEYSSEINTISETPNFSEKVETSTLDGSEVTGMTDKATTDSDQTGSAFARPTAVSDSSLNKAVNNVSNEQPGSVSHLQNIVSDADTSKGVAENPENVNNRAQTEFPASNTTHKIDSQASTLSDEMVSKSVASLSNDDQHTKTGTNSFANVSSEAGSDSRPRSSGSTALAPNQDSVIHQQPVEDSAIPENEAQVLQPDSAISVVHDPNNLSLAGESSKQVGPANHSEKNKSEENKPAQSDRGLGHSLGDILSEENTSSQLSELALFHDQPDVQNDQHQSTRGYQFPSTALLTPPVLPDESQLDEWIEHQGEVLDETLKAFHVDAHVVDWTVGPTVTQFQVHLALGVKVNKITNLTDDLKLALAAKDIRIEAPIPGKTTVGIEIPNPQTRPVMLSEVLESDAFKTSQSPLTVALGVDLFGQPKVTDLRKMPHGLIAGATGSGKSVFINSLLISLLYKATPAELRLILIDPKAVELAPYDGLPHLLSPVISDPKAAAAALKWAVGEMDDRYERLAAAGVRNIEQYNERAELTEDYGQKLPYIVIVIDELADLMMMASSEVQDYIVRITQKARAAGIHLLIATQRPSVDIVTGVIKNNIPTRVAFMVSSQVDSRTILDTSGAERLLGKGDMLFLGNGASQPVRLQGTFVDEEVDRVTDFVRDQGEPHYEFNPDGLLKKQQVQESQDELLPEVLDYIVQEKTVSTSKLQRVFSIGYNRAANLIDTLEDKQYISGQNGSKPRDVFLTEKQLAEIRAPRTD
ncbi:DNA translocase FtsK [Secundilactobacillus folii]|uniref:DNA translocase FtsK n=1 Tax=Secundilactobacillus folii TaxID=2678357 RepID=A0A7X3C3K8_9LACO|nr:DNA translocase FtsK [Secundilactobacillus folii]MTV82622.1 cell division protein FtsK [Secundilactobacillus folii]